MYNMLDQQGEHFLWFERSILRLKYSFTQPRTEGDLPDTKSQPLSSLGSVVHQV